MNIKFPQIAITVAAVMLITACKTNKRLEGMDNIGKSKTTLQNLTPLAPHGMVFVPAGTIIEKDVVTDTSMTVDTVPKTVTVSAFFMDAKWMEFKFTASRPAIGTPRGSP